MIMSEQQLIYEEDRMKPAAEAGNFLAMIERAARDPTIDVDKLDRLLVMRERENARIAEREFGAAMSAAQAEMLPVGKDSANPQTHSKYASYAALDRATRPIYTRHGFGLTFNTERAADLEVRVVCHVRHSAGHVVSYMIDMPADGKGARGNDVMTRTHAVGSGVSYGMRYLLKLIFNLATEEDDGNAASRRPRAPPTPAPNVMKAPAPHDPQTGEILPSGDLSETEEYLRNEAWKGTAALVTAWRNLSIEDQHVFADLKDATLKPIAAEADELKAMDR
jgi:hypothetical protein